MERSEGPEILVVSKHRENARQLQRVLAEAGYGVRIVTTTRDFAAHMEVGELHDLALVDISGFDERIWAPCRGLHDAGVPFLIVGARAGSALEKAGTEHGTGSVLVKPLIVQELLMLIRELYLARAVI